MLEEDEFDIPDPATILAGTVALWLLSLIGSFHSKNRITIMEAGGLEALSNKLASYSSNPQVLHDCSTTYFDFFAIICASTLIAAIECDLGNLFCN